MDEIQQLTQLISVSINGVQMAGKATKEFLKTMTRLSMFVWCCNKAIAGQALGHTNTKGKTRINNLKQKGGTLSMHTLDRKSMELFRKKAAKYGILYSECSRFYEKTRELNIMGKTILQKGRKSEADTFFIAYPLEQQEMVNKLMEEIEKEKLKAVKEETLKNMKKSERASAKEAEKELETVNTQFNHAKAEYEKLLLETEKARHEMLTAQINAEISREEYEYYTMQAEQLKEDNPEEYLKLQQQISEKNEIYEKDMDIQMRAASVYEEKNERLNDSRTKFYNSHALQQEKRENWLNKVQKEKTEEMTAQLNTAYKEAENSREDYEWKREEFSRKKEELLKNPNDEDLQADCERAAIRCQKAKSLYEAKVVIADKKEKELQQYLTQQKHMFREKKLSLKERNQVIKEAMKQAKSDFEDNNYAISQEQFVQESGLHAVSDEQFDAHMQNHFEKEYPEAKQEKFMQVSMNEDVKKNYENLEKKLLTQEKQKEFENRYARGGNTLEIDTKGIVDMDLEAGKIRIEDPVLQTTRGQKFYTWMDIKDLYPSEKEGKLMAVLDDDSDIVLADFKEENRQKMNGRQLTFLYENQDKQDIWQSLDFDGRQEDAGLKQVSSERTEETHKITINVETLLEEETNSHYKTRVPGTYGENIRYLYLQKENAALTDEGKTIFTRLKKDGEYVIEDKNGQRYPITGEQMFRKYYDPVNRRLNKLHHAKTVTLEKEKIKQNFNAIPGKKR